MDLKVVGSHGGQGGERGGRCDCGCGNNGGRVMVDKDANVVLCRWANNRCVSIIYH